MAKLFDGARMTSTTTGVAGTATTMTLVAAVGGYLSFAAAGVADQDVVTYGISDGTSFEIGRGTWTAASSTLSRSTIIKSTNSNLPIALSGSQQVYITAAAEDLVTTSSPNPFFGFGPAHNLQVSPSVAANALTISLKTNLGVDATEQSPIQIPFRDSTLANGGPLWRQVKAALSITVPSGQTLGSPSGALAFRFWLVAIDNGGTVELGLINCSTASATSAAIFPLAEHSVQSTTAIAAAPSAGVIYSTTARTSKAITLLAYVEFGSGLTTAGTYSSGPTETQLFGPGIKKPGDIVQTNYMTTSTASPTTSSTFATSTVTNSITPTSAANLIKYEFFGNAANSNAAATNTYFAMHRGATQIGFYGELGGLTGTVAVSGHGLDAPGATSSQTYAVKVRSFDNVTTASFPGSNGVAGTVWGGMSLTELMG